MVYNTESNSFIGVNTIVYNIKLHGCIDVKDNPILYPHLPPISQALLSFSFILYNSYRLYLLFILAFRLFYMDRVHFPYHATIDLIFSLGVSFLFSYQDSDTSYLFVESVSTIQTVLTSWCTSTHTLFSNDIGDNVSCSCCYFYLSPQLFPLFSQFAS